VSQGQVLGITTGGLETAAHIKLSRAGLNRFFSFGGYGSDAEDRTELTRRAIQRAAAILGRPLEAQHVMVVGDTPLDVEAAHGAGAIAVGVASGHYAVEELDKAGADYVLASLSQPLPGTE
jgi:phosphoglycolate phosphatase-like HAD superfamily hydrolase